MNPANILVVLQLIDHLLASAGKYSALAKQAASEGRDISDAEIATLQADDDDAKAALDAAIAARRAAGG